MRLAAIMLLEYSVADALRAVDGLSVLDFGVRE
jgi:hypothetical protein